jgi:hypothetical protein
MQRLGSSMPEQPQLLNCKGLQSGMPGIEQLFTVSVGEVNAATLRATLLAMATGMSNIYGELV